jgi:hypothetical protein
VPAGSTRTLRTAPTLVRRQEVVSSGFHHWTERFPEVVWFPAVRLRHNSITAAVVFRPVGVFVAGPPTILPNQGSEMWRRFLIGCERVNRTGR